MFGANTWDLKLRGPTLVLSLVKVALPCCYEKTQKDFNLKICPVFSVVLTWYYMSVCQRRIVHPLILNAWLPTGHYEISSPLQLSSMSLDASRNVALLLQAGLTFVPRCNPMPPGSPTVKGAKEQRLKTAKSSGLMATKLWHPSHSDSLQVKSCWKEREPPGHGIKVWTSSVAQ